MNLFVAFPLVFIAASIDRGTLATKHMLPAILETPFSELSDIDAKSVVAECSAFLEDETRPGMLARLHESRGDAFHVLKKYQEAVSDYEKSMESDPNNHQAKWKRARSLCAVGKADEGMRAMEVLIRDNKNLSRPYVVLAFILNDQGEYDKAYEYTKEAERANKDDPLTYWIRALCLYNMKKWGKAKEAVDRFVLLQPFAIGMAYDNVYAVRGCIYDRLGDHRAALTNYRMSQKLNPTSLQAGLGVAETYLHMGHNELAFQAAQQVLQFAPNEVTALYAATTTAARVGEHEAEAKYAKRALAVAPYDPEALWRAGNASYFQKDYTKACEHYEAALGYNRRHLNTLNSYTVLLSTCPDKGVRDAKKALELATRASKLAAPDDHETMSVRSLAMAASGDFDGAIRIIKKCLVLAENDEKCKERYALYLEQFNQKGPVIIED